MKFVCQNKHKNSKENPEKRTMGRSILKLTIKLSLLKQCDIDSQIDRRPERSMEESRKLTNRKNANGNTVMTFLECQVERETKEVHRKW